MKKTFNVAMVAFATILFGTQALASGGYGGGGGVSGGRSYTPAPKAVDTVYETGKSIFRGRQSGEPALSYCVISDGEKVPVKRKSLKSYKKTNYSTLAENLYNCDDPETLISKQLTRDSMLYVLYYLNKRHKLGLSSSSS